MQKVSVDHIFIPVKNFLATNWKGISIILLLTLVFFWPMVTRISSYSEGGDASFNAWTLSRNHNCFVQDNCPNYSDANIYFPNKDTMLYSETQLSAGLVTFPLKFINDNPIFAYNIWTIVSFFLSGLFMYLLARFITKGNEVFSIAAGLIFEFAPYKMAAVSHLQNLSIFCLPLIVLFVLKYVQKPLLKYLVGLFLALLYVFYASWYQMVFAGIGLGVLVLSLYLFRVVSIKRSLAIAAITLLAVLATLPLAKEYVRFSKTNSATFSIKEQVLYSSSVVDYVTPHSGTAAGKLFYHLSPNAHRDAYNRDSFSYHGITLYIIGSLVFILALLARKKSKAKKLEFGTIAALAVVGVVGLVLSLGPLLKFKAGYFYPAGEGINLAIPAPYILVDKFLPQLSFIRAIGRISVLFLFALCCALAYFALLLYRSKLSETRKRVVAILVIGLLAFELMPLHGVVMSKHSYAYNLSIPEVYRHIKAHKEIDNIIVLRAKEYPGATFDVARSEDILWSGYHNRNLFNGYSGYTPPTYFSDIVDFVNFTAADIPKLKKLGLKYVLVDKPLMTDKKEALQNLRQSFGNGVYEDERYLLYKIK